MQNSFGHISRPSPYLKKTFGQKTFGHDVQVLMPINKSNHLNVLVVCLIPQRGCEGVTS